MGLLSVDGDEVWTLNWSGCTVSNGKDNQDDRNTQQGVEVECEGEEGNNNKGRWIIDKNDGTATPISGKSKSSKNGKSSSNAEGSGSSLGTVSKSGVVTTVKTPNSEYSWVDCFDSVEDIKWSTDGREVDVMCVQDGEVYQFKIDTADTGKAKVEGAPVSVGLGTSAAFVSGKPLIWSPTSALYSGNVVKGDVDECYEADGEPVCRIDGGLRNVGTGEDVKKGYLTVDEVGGVIRSYNEWNQVLAEVNIKGERIVARERGGGGGVKVMGDDGVLVKWPGSWEVVITERMEGFGEAKWVSGEGGDGGIKKPRGVEPQGDLKKETKIPTLYVTVYDSVTLDILYRVGHDDAQGKVNVATSGGNWIIYSYWNGKTKRTEISAITLYSGLVPSGGITMFKNEHPRKEEGRSRYEGYGAISLQRTYWYDKAITGMGVTSTRHGITPASIVLELMNGQVATLDLRMLDPRRPGGEPKLTEKMEGLMKYDPNLPHIPLNVVTYDRPGRATGKVWSSGDALESTSRILCTGRGGAWTTKHQGRQRFDELPGNFNKTALVAGVVGLIVIYGAANEYARGKKIKMAWM